jgi:heme exporter protein C
MQPTRWAKLFLLPYLGAVIAAAFFWPRPAAGFIGESSRIVFFHVPCAWTASIAFLVAAVYSAIYLKTGNPWHDDLASGAVRVGLVFAVLALVTGSLFARIMWGSFWNWDPRESSFLILVFLYGGYLFLRSAVDDASRRGRIAAAYALFALVLMPFLVFVAPRITQSLHPQTVINPEMKNLMDGPTRTVFYSAVFGFLGLFVWMLSLDARAGRLSRVRTAESEMNAAAGGFPR